MAVVDLLDIGAGLTRGQRLLGLDVGSKTVGLALSDATLTIATPIETIRRTKFKADADALLAIATAREVGGLVLGLPINMNGSEGPRCQSVRQFAKNLAVHTDLPMAFWDERLSTAAVMRTMMDADLSRQRRGQLVDMLAAGYILQGALDRLAEARAGLIA
ncbi:MAG: Holliday junction resolvase RuvX [Alphaproteobacteria bacterium]|nr:Holliday junction resolvase RuvX [Alphaproteobacteria bacterium]